MSALSAVCTVLWLAAAPNEAALARQSEVNLDAEPKARRGRYKPPGSPQRFLIAIKAGPYTPNVDQAYNGPGFGPYATVFGKTNDAGLTTGPPAPSVMIGLGFEWQFFYLAGPFLLGTDIGVTWDRANAPYANPPDEDHLRSAADRVEFGMVPIALQVGYRFELLADRYRIPIVPFAKVGPVYSFWWSLDGDGNVSQNDTGKGHGGVWGWQINAGGMLRLDFIEPGTAKKLDQYSGINHTYLFGELQYSRIDNFGVGNSIRLGDVTGFAGFAFEF